MLYLFIFAAVQWYTKQNKTIMPVSYTHLDVYKRQELDALANIDFNTREEKDQFRQLELVLSLIHISDVCPAAQVQLSG